MDEEKEAEERGFKIVDRRREGRDEAAAETPASKPEPPKSASETSRPSPQAAPSSEQREREGEAPTATPTEGATPAPFQGNEAFTQFLMSLATSVYMHLGLVPAPEGEMSEKNLPLAKQSIDILAMLEGKTQGNRTKEEDALIAQILSELRMRYVEATKTS